MRRYTTRLYGKISPLCAYANNGKARRKATPTNADRRLARSKHTAAGPGGRQEYGYHPPRAPGYRPNARAHSGMEWPPPACARIPAGAGMAGRPAGMSDARMSARYVRRGPGIRRNPDISMPVQPVRQAIPAPTTRPGASLHLPRSPDACGPIAVDAGVIRGRNPFP